MNILESTRLYERWLGQQTQVVSPDLKRKHQFMAEALFPFFRATFYRWLQVWPKVCKHLQDAPRITCVGDLHLENFGTWRDSEGRLVWGINDFDQAAQLPYLQDLVRLASSALLAESEGRIEIKARLACERILEGYLDSIRTGGQPLVLAEKNRFLREIAQQQLRDPQIFWDRLQAWPTAAKKRVPREIVTAFDRSLPRGVSYRIVARQSGVGSRGLPRFAAVCDYQGGLLCREAKALVPPASCWLDPLRHADGYHAEILQKAVRDPDVSVSVVGSWLLRRLAPDCTKIRLADLPAKRSEERMLFAAGWETGNVHLANAKAVPAILADLKKRKAGWLFTAAQEMSVVVRKDWKVWRSEFQI